MQQDTGNPRRNERSEAGQETVELGLLVALIVVVVIAALTLTGINFSATLMQLDAMF